MLILFFTIIFFAELIVAGWVISKIRLASVTVCELNQQIIEFQPQLEKNLKKAREITTLLNTKLSKLTTAVKEKQEFQKRNFIIKLASKIAMWLLKIPYKKIITVIEIFLTIRKIFKKYQCA